MLKFLNLKVQDAFTFVGDDVVNIRVRGGYRCGRGGPVQQSAGHHPVVLWTGVEPVPVAGENNRVWIELDKPREYYSTEQSLAFCKEQCRLANNMLQRLGEPGSGLGTKADAHFWWNDHRNEYCYTQSSAGTYCPLPGNEPGYWFNLSFFGRDIT